MTEVHEKKPFTLDGGTLFALSVAFSLMPLAQILSAYVLPKSAPRRLRYLFIWHAYDFLTHFMIEGSFLYHCFFSYKVVSASSLDTTSGPFFLGHESRRYGPLYSESPMARLWQEYAKADHRWGGADLTVISLELLTVGLAGPAAMYICYLIARMTNAESRGKDHHRTCALMWFTAIMLATGELYGGFMTFAPEWLSGNTQLQGDDPVYLWLYLVFFNVLWVFMPIWVLFEAWKEIATLYESASQVSSGPMSTKKRK